MIDSAAPSPQHPTATMRKAASLLDMEAAAKQHQQQHQQAHVESARHSSQPHHHAHRSLDTPTGASVGAGVAAAGGVPAFSFSMAGENDALSPRSLQPDRLNSSTHAHAHAHAQAHGHGHKDAHDGDEPTPFDFQVSVSSTAPTPDIGLDDEVDAPQQPSLDAFLSPAVAPVGHGHGQGHKGGLTLQTHSAHQHPVSAGAGAGSPMVHEPSSAPSGSAHDPFASYDLLTRPATGPANGKASKGSSAQQHDRDRARLDNALDGVLEDGEDALPHSKAPSRAMSPKHRGLGPNLTDLLGSSPARPSPLNVATNKGDGGAADVFFTKQDKPRIGQASSATLPAHVHLGELVDMWSSPSSGAAASPPASAAAVMGSNGVSATGTRSSRSHTATGTADAADLGLDAFFVPRAVNSNANANTNVAQTQNATASAPATAALAPTKQQRTKSEADQAEQAILQFQL